MSRIKNESIFEYTIVFEDEKNGTPCDDDLEGGVGV